MNESAIPLSSYLPALGLLALLGLVAWGAQWLKKRMVAGGHTGGAKLRLVSQLALGQQQRVVVVEVAGPQGTVQLTLGVTPQHVRTLHTATLPTTVGLSDAQPIPAEPAVEAPRSVTTPSYKAVAQAVKDAVS
jgi:flagellar protein FliO/FliZ